MHPSHLYNPKVCSTIFCILSNFLSKILTIDSIWQGVLYNEKGHKRRKYFSHETKSFWLQKSSRQSFMTWYVPSNNSPYATKRVDFWNKFCSFKLFKASCVIVNFLTSNQQRKLHWGLCICPWWRQAGINLYNK